MQRIYFLLIGLKFSHQFRHINTLKFVLREEELSLQIVYL